MGHSKTEQTYLATAILAMTTAAASWSKLADMWFRLVEASAQLENTVDFVWLNGTCF